MEEEGNPLNRSAKLLQSLDVDTSLTAFIEYFCNKFIPLIPQHLLSNKEFLIAHAKEFYRNKGNENSFKLLFKLIFNEDIQLYYPKDDILRVSDGKWIRDKFLRVNPVLRTYHNGDGSAVEFRILGNLDQTGNVTVSINGVQQNSGYYVSRNKPCIIFSSAPGANANVEIQYDGNNLLEIFNSQGISLVLTGNTSGATAVMESAKKYFIDGIELLSFTVSSVEGNFISTEEIYGKYLYDYANNNFLTIRTDIASVLDTISVIDGGANYNIGDSVPIVGGNPTSNALAVIEDIYTALIHQIRVVNGGCGYQAGQIGYISSTPNTGLSFAIGSVDKTGTIHPNSYPMVTDVLSLFANTIMSNSNYYFNPSGVEDANTIMANAFSTIVFGGSGPQGLGPITNVAILLSTDTFTTSPTIKFDSPVITVQGNTANGQLANANVSLSYFGILGRMRVVAGGDGYKVGDEVVITNLPGLGIGIGGAAEVTEVHSSNSGIKTVQFQPHRVTGTVNVNSSNVVVGTGTLFTTELMANDKIEINNETSYIQTITNNNYLIVNTSFSRVSTNRKLGVFNRYFVGGINYSMNALPIATVVSSNTLASGANVLCEQVLSHGDVHETVSEEGIIPGEIKSIRVSYPGFGYKTTPTVDLSNLGNGRANALAILISSLFTSEGYYKNQDGMISSDRKLEGLDSYHQHSYVIKSKVELNSYKNILKALLHPAGYKLYGEYVIENAIEDSRATESNNTVTITTP